MHSQTRSMIRRPRALTAALAVLALLLAACSGGGGGGGLPEDPQQAVVDAFQNRADGGLTATLSVQLSDSARQQALEDAPEMEGFLDTLTGDGVLTVTSQEDQFALAANFADGRPIQVRALGDAFYVLVDVPTILEFAEADVDLEQLRSQVGQFSMFLGDLATFVEAALDGSWAGVTNIPDDAGDQIREAFGSLGGATADPEQASEIASEIGVTDPAAFAENYLEVQQGEEGRYTAVLLAREFVRASAQAASDLSPQGAAAVPSDEQLQQVPERIEGIIIETEGDQVSALEADVGAMAASADAGADVQEGDIVLRVEFSDPSTDLLTAPSDAQTIEFDAVLETIDRLAQFAEGFGGGLGGSGSQSGAGTATEPAEVPTEFSTEVPTDLPTEFSTELPSELQTEFEQP